MSAEDNDPQLTAYTLGELSRKDAESFHNHVQQDSDLKKREQEIREISDMLALGFGTPENAGLTSDQRRAIFRSVDTGEDEAVIQAGQKPQWRSYIIALGSAAAVLCMMFLLLRDYTDRNQPKELVGVNWDEISDNTVLTRFSENDLDWEKLAVISQETSSANHNIGRGAIRQKPSELRTESALRSQETNFNTLENTSLDSVWKPVEPSSIIRVPLVCGLGSWALLTKSIEQRETPNVEDIRIEEIINAINYDSPTDVIIGGLSAGLEVVYCPWNKENVIVSVLLKSASSQEGLQVGISFDHCVSRYRLIGYSDANDSALPSPAALNIPEGYSHMVLYELELPDLYVKGNEVVRLHLKSSSNQFEETFVTSSFVNKSWKEAGANTRLALCLAAWAQDISNHSMEMKLTRTIFQELPKKNLSDSAKDVLHILMQHLQGEEERTN